MGGVISPFRLKAATDKALLQIMHKLIELLYRRIWPAPENSWSLPETTPVQFHGKWFCYYSISHLFNTRKLLRSNPTQKNQGHM
jgi:hypothetical protein